VLFGTATILIVALLGGRLLGERAKLRAAWLAALAPSLVWWSAPLLKEALATMLIALGLLAITYLPRPRAVAGLGALLAFLAILRGPAALALVVGALLALALAGRRAERKRLSRPLVTFVVILLAGVVVVGVVVSRGNLHNLYSQYRLVVHNMITQYQGGNPVRIPYDIAKSLVTPLPWVFDRGTANWDRALFPGVWLIMCALPLAAIGVWRLRRSPEAWALIGTAATALTINAVTGGFVFRQRSMIEPLILLFALAGARSWRMAARSAAVTLGVVAVGAAVQSRSPLVTALIAAGAGALYLLSRRLPAEPFDPPPESPMVVSFSRSLEARDEASRSVPGIWRIWASRVKNGVSRLAPKLDASAPTVASERRPRARALGQGLARHAPPAGPLPGERPEARARKVMGARAAAINAAPPLDAEGDRGS
jgi:hypothetical protein